MSVCVLFLVVHCGLLFVVCCLFFGVCWFLSFLVVRGVLLVNRSSLILLFCWLSVSYWALVLNGGSLFLLFGTSRVLLVVWFRWLWILVQLGRVCRLVCSAIRPLLGVFVGICSAFAVRSFFGFCVVDCVLIVACFFSSFVICLCCLISVCWVDVC